MWKQGKADRIFLPMLLLSSSLQCNSMNILIEFIFKTYKLVEPCGSSNVILTYNFNDSCYYTDNKRKYDEKEGEK